MRYILTADWHLRADTPLCRTDDFQTAQWAKVRAAFQHARKHQAKILIAGDLFDKPKPSLSLVYQTMQVFREYADVAVCAVPGNHDMPAHSITEISASAYGLMELSGLINSEKSPWEYYAGWNAPVPTLVRDTYGKFNILIHHAMVLDGPAPKGWGDTWDANLVLEQYPQFDLILTGHNHTRLIHTLGNRCLVNPGCLTRQTAAEEDHQPQVLLLDTTTREYKVIPLEVEPGVVSREHIDVITKRDECIEEFVDSLNKPEVIELDFIKNLEQALLTNELADNTKDVLLEIMEELR